MGGTINEQFPVGVTKTMVLEGQLRRVTAERTALRAELAAAKNLLARIHRDGGHHTEAVGFAQSVADAGDKVSEWLLAAAERTALAAHVERLVGVLAGVCKLRKRTEATHQAAYEAMFKLPGRKAFEDAADALAAHDADVKVAVLREVADKLRSEESSNSNLHAEFIEAEAIQIKAEADRIEKGKHAK